MLSDKMASAARTYARALGEVRAFWPHLGLVLLLGLLGTPLGLLAPLPVKIVVDNVLGDEALPWPFADLVTRHHALALAIGLAASLVLLTLAHRLGEWLFREWLAERMVADFRGKLFERAVAVAAPGQEAAATQDLAFRIASDAPALQWTALHGVIPVIVSLAALAGTLWVTAAISPALAAIAVATTLPAGALIHLTQKRMRGKWHGVREAESRAQAVVQEVLGAVRLVVTFGQERRELQRFAGACDVARRARLKALGVQGILGAALTLSTALGSTAILYIGVREVMAQSLTVGDLLLVIAYVAQLYEPLQQIGTHVTGQQQAIASAERAFALLDRPTPVAESAAPLPLGRAIGDITFREVGFAYAGGAPVLDGVDLDIPAGAFVGIVGRTGAGKSTLAGLLLRLFDPVKGKILLDGADLRDLSLADLRRQFAVVPQDPVLFSTTIAENIAYGRPEATIEEIVAAATAARAHDFIMALPKGYATEVGERGTRLSGGERQRIALARAFLKDAPILILDEPTSAIDGETEAAIVESMERLMAGRTTFMIAHRLSTLRKADMILRVADGRVERLAPQPTSPLPATPEPTPPLAAVA